MSRLSRIVALILTLLIMLVLAVPAFADLSAQETPLSPTGAAYELNLDSQGTLWVSDGYVGEIWAFDSASGAYTTYKVQGAPSDARGDGAGAAWWANFGSNQLSRLSTSDDRVTTWKIPSAKSLNNTALDGSKYVWASDSSAPSIYRLDPTTTTNNLCSYALPNSGVSEYMYYDDKGQQLWFGDSANGRIVRLQNDTFTWWNLPANSDPRDVELDGSGQLWWTDYNLGYLGRLDPVNGQIATFTPPASGTPVMLKLSGGKVWYSQQDPGGVVMLDPAVAASQSPPVTSGSQPATWTITCSRVTRGFSISNLFSNPSRRTGWRPVPHSR